jgi:DNA-binding NarL/FixJ family response regulator
MTAAVSSAVVFLVAENRLLREALARILDKKSDLTVVGSCAFSSTALDQIVAANPDVLILDSFSLANGHLNFMRAVQTRIPRLSLVLIGMEDDEQAFLRTVREGALGYVLKDASALDVVAAVRAVANGEAACPPHLCAALFRFVTRQSNQVPNINVKLGLGLTQREQQLVLLISQGLSNKEIASQLSLAEQTVRNHVHRMLRKVGASDRLAVVELCRIQGMAV